ncbi:uncharacterized protein [Symphalangus syndactylus]|uniref:uncharacterized protein isoform X1 n=1 Tax=Symphalangus syndactylus TaxID=9590 RepID=UPI0030053559
MHLCVNQTLPLVPQMATASRFYQFLNTLHSDSWLITNPSLPLHWLMALEDLYLQGTFMDFTSNKVFMYSTLLLGLMLILYPMPNPDSSPCAPSPQHPHSAGRSQMNHDAHFPPFKKIKREEY